MKDSYLNFANTSFGAKLTSMLGLPQPLLLERYSSKEKSITDSVLVGTSEGHELCNSLCASLERIGLRSLLHSSFTPASQNIWQADQQVKALLFDASGLSSSDKSIELHSFFSETVRNISANGRVIIVGRPPKQCQSPSKAIVQRSLEGLSRSLAKELRNAITVQLVYVEHGAENNLESTVRFLLSAKSCYVSAQVINVSKAPVTLSNEFNWSQPLSGKKVLITGASQGIGAAISEVMARDGAELICLDIPQTKDALTRLSDRLNGRALVLDLSDENSVERLVREAKNDGGWDVIVHNAGITRDKTIAKMTPHLWSSVVNINLSCQERINNALIASDGINQGGRIVCVSSISGIAGNRGQSNYALSKAGVIGMVESLAPILAENNITINAVAPGFIETKMTAAIPFAVREAGRRLNSMSQGGQPIDVAETITWLASPASNGLTANVIRVCGQSILGA